MLYFQPEKIVNNRSDVQEGSALSSLTMQFSRSLEDLSQQDFTPSLDNTTLALASFSVRDGKLNDIVTQNNGVIPLQQVTSVDDAFASPDSWGSRAIGRAEHGERVPPKGAVDWTEFDHQDPGDPSRWNRGYCSTLASSPEAGNQRCLEDNRADGQKAMQEFRAAGLTDPGPVAFINLVDLYNQRPIAAPHYAAWLAKLLNQGMPAQEAVLQARVEAFRQNGSGNYITGGPINPQTGTPQWPGLEGICKTSPAYDYIEKDMGLAKGSQPWLRQCILHNQKQRWERINVALEAHGKLQYGSLANAPAARNPSSSPSPAQQPGRAVGAQPGNGNTTTTQPVEGARAPAVQLDVKNVPGGWGTVTGVVLIAAGFLGFMFHNRNQSEDQYRGRYHYGNSRDERRRQARQRSTDFANELRRRKGPFK